MEPSTDPVARLFLYYLGGTVIWLLLVSAIPATQDLTPVLLLNLATLTLGVTLGLLGRSTFEKRPWLLLFVPSAPLVLGIFF